MKYTAIGAALLGGMMMVNGANAATITFNGNQNGGSYEEAGFVFDDVRIVNGNCDSVSGRPCGAENNNEVSIMTQVNDLAFSVSSMWFQLLGKGTGNAMILSTDKGSHTFAYPEYETNNDGQTLNLADAIYGGIFSGISYFQIASSNSGNIRFDDINASEITPAPIPVPAAGFLLAGGLGLLALKRRRKA